MNIKVTTIEYMDHNRLLEGFFASPIDNKNPLVILCHAWAGRDDFICNKAKLLAESGYASFAIDVYGKGILGSTPEECMALKQSFLLDRKMLQRCLLKGLEIAKSLESVDQSRIAAIGYGFGGLCALDLARYVQEIKAAVSVYGHFEPPGFPTKPIQSKILIMHGANDPIVPVQELLDFGKELDNAGTEWQANIFSNSMHAFTSPSANDPEHGVLYNPISAQHCWEEILFFLSRVLHHQVFKLV